MFGLFERRRASPEPAALYGSLVAQARLPIFYADYGVQDTVDGRFGMVVLHVWAASRRLSREGERGKALAQEVFDLFVADMEDSLREIGVGDLSVPKAVKRMGAAFYGAAAAYDAALVEQGSESLAQALARNVLGGKGAAAAGRLAAYVLALTKSLDDSDPASFFAGRFDMPDPTAIGEGWEP